MKAQVLLLYLVATSVHILDCLIKQALTECLSILKRSLKFWLSILITTLDRLYIVQYMRHLRWLVDCSTVFQVFTKTSEQQEQQQQLLNL